MKIKLSSIYHLLSTFIIVLIFNLNCFAQTASDFSAKDINGKTHSLKNYAGKIVVLEWFNPGCPYVKKHYESGNMQKLQQTYTDKGVIWLTINSSAEGKQGYMTDDEAKAKVATWNIKSTAMLVDPEGIIGKAYNAKTTPHMFVINQKGSLAYQGAIDDNDSAKISSIEGAKNYVSQTIDELLANKPISISETESYGCSVKYKS
jgi:glutathione peroxidase-family protein